MENINGERLVVVSNRLPFTLKKSGEAWRTERSTGGLATAMGPLLEQSGGIWIGWSGEASGAEADPKRQKMLARWEQQQRYYAVDLPPDMAEGFYEGYSNRTIWPLFHQFPMMVEYDPTTWEAYREANERFRDVVLKHLRPGDTVWIHDYQLMLLPQLLREAVPDARIGFFLHIPFPPADIFRILPRREELLRGLLGADYLAFHTYGYLQHFRSSLLRLMGFDSRMDKVEVNGRFVHLDALPIGIAPEEFERRLDEDAETRNRRDELRERFKGRRILLSVDRLDYTKGIPERLRTFERLLKKSPELHKQIVFVQVAVPSRENIPSYEELRRNVDELVGGINGEFSTPGWTPVVYMRRAIPPTELIALYSIADVAWVAPLRDGLNLVAKEYVACQREEQGVLVLSEFAGAASEMGEALLVNPYDEERTADTLARALEMPEAERRERMNALRRRIHRNNVFAWGERFLSNLRDAADARLDTYTGRPETLPVAETVAAYASAESRFILLDYDGTLVPYAARPQDAVPPAHLIELLATLARDPANCIAIVSGRHRRDLESWFGEIDGLWLAAEHGASVRASGESEWQPLRANIPVDWKERVLPVLEHFVDRTPGSFIEEKDYSLVWHYRMSEPDFGEWLGNELVATMEEMLAATELRAVRGVKSVEVRLAWAHKGELVARLTEACLQPQFCFAAGDDRTDEDIFERMPADSWTVHIGDRRSQARYRLRDPQAVWDTLRAFADASNTKPLAAVKTAE
ncbi:MAG TPA: bifunctional alpha,alpha-trehalose-phosphate synthase (UDP-forming)/trehalose-phosphatase [Pyrinomonadaceae bacterium]|jgi:trehalose 6-phosphate synthase/phosphatase